MLTPLGGSDVATSLVYEVKEVKVKICGLPDANECVFIEFHHENSVIWTNFILREVEGSSCVDSNGLTPTRGMNGSFSDSAAASAMATSNSVILARCTPPQDL